MSSRPSLGYPGKHAFMTETESHIGHVLRDGRVIYPGADISVKCSHGGSTVQTGTADLGYDSETKRTYLVFVDKYGNTHCPLDSNVV